MITLEICCESPHEVQIASRFNIDRIELSSNLHDYGMSPTLASLIRSLSITEIPVVCSVRSRTGGFVYSQEDFELMMEDAEIFLKNKVNGLVFGFLTSDFEIDVEKTKLMVDLTHKYNAEAIFHRAFDCVNDPEESLKILHSIGVDRLITSGCKSTAFEGIETIKNLVEMNLLEILAAGGINKDNVNEIIKRTGVKQVHTSARKPINDLGDHPLVVRAVSSEQYKGKILMIDEEVVGDLVKALNK